jgi:cell volume regulation protein A
MEFASQIIFVAAVLFVASVLATAVTPRLGVPLLLVFLLVGMAAGEDGPGGLHFSDYSLANLSCTAALAVILFDGGMRTRMEMFRVGLKPALMLASVGVVISAVVTGLFAAWLLDIDPVEGLLLGAIVASTDAAAVFSLLHTSAVNLNQRITAALEIESGSNDPMAVVLTLALIEYLKSPDQVGFAQTAFFLVQQMVLGGLTGWFGGRLLVRALNRLELAESLYPILALFGGLMLYGGTALIGGSGFLAVYLAGLVMGNRRLRSGAGIRRFHDGIAWMAQIGMFVMLGLLASPHLLLPVAIPGLLVAVVLTLVARPLAVVVSLLPFRFPWREQVYVSWVGLRGSVPILLATYPLLAGLEHAALFFNVAFFIVLMSLLIQGWTVAPAARLLGLTMPVSTDMVHRIELDLPGQRGYEIVSYRIGEDSRLVGAKPKELPLRDTSRVICIARKGKLIQYREWGGLRPLDDVWLLAAQDELADLDALFRAPAEARNAEQQRFFGEFPIDPTAPLAAVAEAYGGSAPEGAGPISVAEAIGRYLPSPVVGDRMRLGPIELVVRNMVDGRITEVGLRLPHDKGPG